MTTLLEMLRVSVLNISLTVQQIASAHRVILHVQCLCRACVWRCSCLFAHAQLPAPAAEATELPALSILELSAAKVRRCRYFPLIGITAFICPTLFAV